jgi:hypothetical protein
MKENKPVALWAVPRSITRHTTSQANQPSKAVLEELRGRLETWMHETWMHETWMHETWMHETRDPLLEGPVPAPPGAELNGRDQLSANDPTTVV